jgi:ABC-type polysaccharide/polyol phosphate export permease
VQELARFNPMNWGVRAARDAVVYGRNWDGVGLDLLLLVAATAVTAGFATWTFRSYQRTL